MFNFITLDTLFNFIKKYWYIFFIIVVMIYAHARISNIEKVLSLTQDSFNAQIAAQKQSQEEFNKKQTDLINSYQQEMQQITADYSKKLQDLQINKSKQIKKLTITFDNNPQEIINNLTDKFGFTYVH